MRSAWLYALFCLVVVGTFALARAEGWILFGTGVAAANGSSGSSGGRTGVYLGSHK